MIAWLFIPALSMAQGYNRGGNNGNGGGQRGMQMPHIGHLFGRVMDAGSNKPVEFAAVSLLREKDSSVVTGMLTKGNGDFSLDNLPFGQFVVKVNFIGYNTFYKKVTITPQKMEQDLGNFRLDAYTSNLKTAVVTANKPTFSMGIDKKVFNVEKSLASVGGTATDVLRQVPTVNVDIDGNVTLRNGSPTIFVDGKPSVLTLDQIPADEIQSIEIITNPSAKYDAAGMSGIINIILKKDRKPGINGNIMAGAGTGDKYNAGGMLNIYQKPINITLNYFMNSRNAPGNSTTNRDNLFQQTYMNQNGASFDKHLFQAGRLGIDYTLDNRNTLSLSGGIGGGNFNSLTTMNTSYLNNVKAPDSSSLRTTNGANHFRFISADLNYTHNFIKDKEQLTGQVSYRNFNGPGNGIYNTQFFGQNGTPSALPLMQNYNTGGGAGFFIVQADYTDPLNNGKARLETGVKATAGNNSSFNNTYDVDSTGALVFNNRVSYDFNYSSTNYAAYVNFSNTMGKFSYQAGLRYEDYTLSGQNADGTNKFSVSKPGLFPNLFPSLFLTQKLTDNQQLQLNYSRRIERPDWRQMSPRTDYTDPQNLRKGNPALEPEYTNSFEFSYNNNFGNNNLLATLYYRNTNNLITSYVTPLKGDTLLNTFVNANSSNSYGLELTMQNQIAKWWNLTSNINLFQTSIEASNIKSNLTNSGFSWFAKINSDMLLPANFSFQITGNYQGPRVIPQGKIDGQGNLDLAVRKQFLKNKAASLTLSLSDVFNTRKFFTHTESEGFFIQDQLRKRESRILQLTFNYRFGKQNFQLFKKRNNNQNGQDQNIQMSPDDSGGGGPR